ncbi:DUF3159 domain-containing protein [Williamsia phyllosphaerae]|uniref:Membrane protein n=1 Tax=Williamsia phyllosphaerae TaxID=885042 RepID=A0ABQ1V8K8_9NOCA|nr:DUF3159 domain-containing protein [Williamsia phyllosphaerae]GGF40996.1 membrane protein [Williamsia phyllosphaerae]
MTTDPEPDPTVTTEVERVAPTLLEQMGGIAGLIYSTVPIVVFVTVNSIFDLTPAIVAAVAVAVVVLAFRLVRREPIQPAVSGLFGVAICVFIAHRTGDAKGFFLFGIWTSLLYAGVFVVSIVVRWPLVGVIWNVVNANGTAWRKHRRTLIAYDIATAIWAALFGVRYLVQSFLYDSDQTGLLAAARIGMGWPLTALAALATVLLVRRAERIEESVRAPEAIDADSEPSGEIASRD